MHRGSLAILALAIGLGVTSDAGAKSRVSTDTLPGVNFSAYRTFTWIDNGTPAGVNPVMYQRIMGDFEAALASKGYHKGEPADLSLVLTIGAREKTDIETWGRFGLQTSVYQYTEGQLSLDVFETSTKKALWHGQVSDTVNPNKPNPAAADAAITKLMKQFPASAAAGTQP